MMNIHDNLKFFDFDVGSQCIGNKFLMQLLMMESQKMMVIKLLRGDARSWKLWFSYFCKKLDLRRDGIVWRVWKPTRKEDDNKCMALV